MIKAVVFDFDGLTLDTETSWFTALQTVYAKYEVDFPIADFYRTLGTKMGIFDPYTYLAEALGLRTQRAELKQDVLQHYDQIMATQPLREGVIEYLEEAKQLGLRIGMASSSNRAWVEGYLERYRIMHYYDCIHTENDVERVKPDPALYRLAIQSLGVDAAEAIAFEDSVNGLLAAKTCGLYGVVVPNAVTRELPFAAQDYTMNSMLDVPLIELIRRLEKQPPIRLEG